MHYAPTDFMLNPSLVILSKAKNLIVLLRTGSAKNITISISLD